MSNILYKETLNIKCVGKGETKNSAVEDAFKNMRIQVMDRIKHPIISISTDEVILESENEIKRTEAFMYFFSKRERVSLELTFSMVINISYLKI